MSNDKHILIPLFTIQDVKSNIYSVAPWGGLSWDTEAAGIRHFIGILKDNYSSYTWYNPHDYRLFKIGYFDVDSGELVPEHPVLLFDGASLDISSWKSRIDLCTYNYLNKEEI